MNEKLLLIVRKKGRTIPVPPRTISDLTVQKPLGIADPVLQCLPDAEIKNPAPNKVIIVLGVNTANIQKFFILCVISKIVAAKIVYLAVEQVFEASPLRREVKAADARKERCVGHGHSHNP